MRLSATGLALLTVLLTTACSEDNAVVHNARILAFGTLIDVTIIGAPPSEAEAAVEQLETLFARLHREWHAWEDGPLTQTNRQLRTGTFFKPDPTVMPLLTLSMSLADASEDLFNPAIGHLIDLWGFQGNRPDCSRLPDHAQIEEQLQQVPRMSDLQIENGRLQSGNPMLKLDFGAIGKGYGVDLAIQLLQQRGIEHAMINAGGDLRVIGNHRSRPWRIGIKHPDGSVLGSLEVGGDESVFSSGNYERLYRCNGKRYHHIIDPRSGYPAVGTDSVTVIHPDAATADAAATALFIAGPDQWQYIAARMGIRYVALLDNRGLLHMTPKMAQRLKLLNKQVRTQVAASGDAN